MIAIDIRGVSKTFGAHRAVDDLSLEVPEGSIYGFIGPNGSGKTTTIRMIMNIILPGDLVGLQGELMAAPAHGVEALTDIRLCAFDRTALWEIFRNHAELGFDVTWLAAHEERLLDEALLSVGRRSALERIAMVLVHLYRRAAAVGLEQDGTVPFPLTQTHLADLMGLSPVHVNRTIQALRKRQLIRLNEGRLAIGDLSALQRVAEYWERPAAQRIIEQISDDGDGILIS